MMKMCHYWKCVILWLWLLVTMSAGAQEFIGCHADSGWAEAPMLRKSFVLSANDFKHADFQTMSFVVEVTSLGYHEVYVNGVKVGDDVLQPAVSQLNKRTLNVTYNITDLVHEGNNEIMLWIGQGWGRIYGTPAAVKAAVVREVSDGECGLSDSVVWTDSTWEASPSPYSYTGSWEPLRFGGERYDARVKPDWRPASVFGAKGIAVSRQKFGGNRIVDTVGIQAFELLPDSSLLLDFGRVVTGWFAAVFVPQHTETEDDEPVALPAGTEVTIEYLDHRHALPPHTEKDVYISDGSGRDLFRNRFHTHSFRYVRVKGAGTVYARALRISAVNPREGATFECNDPRLNAIHDMVKYTLSCLTFSGYMVDCPHLERMGYGGDGNSSTMTLQTLWDVRDTYRNWMTAWDDAMEADGELPYVAPAYRTGGGPYWSSFIIQAPWRTYLNYGDRRLIVEYYGTMKRWLDFIERNSKDGLLQPWPDNERHTWFLGDWLAPEGVDIGGESVLHVSNCVISECLADMVQMARLLRRAGDAERFAVWRQNLNVAIHKAFYHPETHTYANGTPLDQCYALLMDIPPDSTTAAAVKEQLMADIHGKYHDHIAAGLMGVPIFTEWCIRERQTELMATILRQQDYPGYLHMLNNGATTTWESWDCGRPGKEDRSRVHNCYNGIGIWFYQALAGIRPDPEQPGYKHFFLDPQPCEGITTVRATKPTAFGIIGVEIENDNLTVTVPQGTTATIFPRTPYERNLGGGHHQLKIQTP